MRRKADAGDLGGLVGGECYEGPAGVGFVQTAAETAMATTERDAISGLDVGSACCNAID